MTLLKASYYKISEKRSRVSRDIGNILKASQENEQNFSKVLPIVKIILDMLDLLYHVASSTGALSNHIYFQT